MSETKDAGAVPGDFDLESVYDAEIAPLMTQLLAVCKAHKMPMFASFVYRDGKGEDGERSYCTSLLQFAGRLQPALDECFRAVKSNPSFAAFTITTKREPTDG